jgi:hypothetical protein
MNPLTKPDFATDRCAQSNAFNALLRAGTYSAGNCFNCYQLFEDERAEVAAWFAPAFRAAMRQNTPDPAQWQVFKNAISLFKHKEQWGRVTKWSDLHQDSKDALFGPFLPALVMAAGIAYVNPSQHFARFYYGVRSPHERPHLHPRQIALQLLEALSTPSAKKNELQDIFWEALRHESRHGDNYGLEVEGAMPLTGGQLSIVAAAKPSPDTLAKNITIDGETYPLSCLLATSSRANDTYAKTKSVASVVTMLQQQIPDPEIRTLVLKYLILSQKDFYTTMQANVRLDALNELRAFCCKITPAIFTLTKGETKIKADDLMGTVLSYWAQEWRVTVTNRHIHLRCYEAEKSTDTFIQLMRKAKGYTFELELDFPMLPEAVRAQITPDLPITSITFLRKDNDWRKDAEVDPAISLLSRLEHIHISPVKSIESLERASALKSLNITSLSAKAPMKRPFPPALVDLQASLKGEETHTSPFPATLKKVSFSTYDKTHFDLTTLPEGIEEVSIHGQQNWLQSFAPRLPSLRNLTKLDLRLHEGNNQPPLGVLQHTPVLTELCLLGQMTLADIGACPHKHVRKITFVPYSAKEYAPASWLDALQKIGSLQDFCTVGEFGPYERSSWSGMEVSFNKATIQLLALAKAAVARKITFTLNGKTPEFILENVKQRDNRWY